MGKIRYNIASGQPTWLIGKEFLNTMRTIGYLTSIATLLTVLGCARHTTPVVPAREMTVSEQNFEDVWQASLTVLRKGYHFEVDRQDRRAGIITTEPMTGKHWFEFWRRDAIGKTGLAESSIQTVFRVAEVRIEPSAEGAETYKPTVYVYAFMSNQEMPQVTNTTEAYDLFNLPGRKERPAGDLLVDSSDDELPEWLTPLGKDGRDRKLEQRLEAKIKARAGL